MHPRNRYGKPPEFPLLAKAYPPLKPHLFPAEHDGGWTIDWRNPRAARELAYALLQVDFGLSVEFPLDRLCPMISGRLEYLHFIEDLFDEFSTGRHVKRRGLDMQVGTGASCIYPLLGCALHANWSFVGTEIDPESLDFAVANVDRNGLSARISLSYNDDPMRVAPADPDYFDFCMSNPPFYDSLASMEASRKLKSRDPTGVLYRRVKCSCGRILTKNAPTQQCTGAEHETCTEGGELGFAQRMLEQSLALSPTAVGIYTVLLGAKSSHEAFQAKLAAVAAGGAIEVLPSRRLMPGVTARWVAAWRRVGPAVEACTA